MQVNLKDVMEICGIEGVSTMETRLVDAGMDSMMYVELIVTIEDRYDVAFPDDKLNMYSYENFLDLQEYVQKLVDQKRGEKYE